MTMPHGGRVGAPDVDTGRRAEEGSGGLPPAGQPGPRVSARQAEGAGDVAAADVPANWTMVRYGGAPAAAGVRAERG